MQVNNGHSAPVSAHTSGHSPDQTSASSLAYTHASLSAPNSASTPTTITDPTLDFTFVPNPMLLP